MRAHLQLDVRSILRMTSYFFITLLTPDLIHNRNKNNFHFTQKTFLQVI